MINKKMIARILGFLLAIEGTLLLLCSGVSIYYKEDDLTSFIYSSLIAYFGSAIFLMLSKGAKKTFSRRDGYVVVTSAWTFFTVFGMLPYMINGYIPDVANAFFETMSGFTTTGATILDNIESMPHGILFWRSLTQFIGGLGIVFFTIAVLPIFGAGGVQLFAAESTGPQSSKTHPRIGVTAKWIWFIYAGLTSLEVIFLMFGGMSFFDSVCHAFTTTSTGGYSTKQASIAYYNSPYIEYVMSVFMLLSGVNFSILLLLVTGRFKKFFGDNELKWYLCSFTFFVGFITLVLFQQRGMPAEQAFRQALFQVASLHTSTGYANADYMLWPAVTWACLTLMMLIGACAGSTSGGIKSIRMVIMTRIAKNEFKHILHPNAVLSVRVNKQVISPSVKNSILAFTFVYLSVVVISSLMLMTMNVGFKESIGCVVSCLGNMGPGLGNFGPAYSWNAMPVLGKWLLSFLMLIGRLEFFTVFLLFTRRFWKRQ